MQDARIQRDKLVLLLHERHWNSPQQAASSSGCLRKRKNIMPVFRRAPRTLELFVESLLTKTLKITNARNAKTLSPSHMKQCIISESRFDFLRDLVKNIPDMGLNEDLSGSEAGYGNEGTSPASTSTSSSSYSNGGPAVATSAVHLPYEVHAKPLLRSESYSPATATISVPLSQHHHHHQHHQHPQGKRGLTQQGGSLNFYKEIPLDGTDSPPPPPPPKLARLNSAPAASTTSASNVPFKIDILPTLPPTGAGPSPTAHATGTGRRGQTNPQPSSGAITPQISYKFERLASTPTSEVTLEPVIKLDYSNLRLPATSTSPHGSTTGPGATATSRTASLQPTIKIDLSSIAGSATSEYGTPKKHNTTESVAASGGGGGGGGVTKQTASPSSTSTTTTVVPLQSPVVPAAPPLFSALSSTIPGMDEDYDDI
uniref:Transcription factor CBF/NF-Y/archaeal histone domain-containing protein n=1 Tax=Anopheles farauti TaxID=69004 RepID=A0A182QXB0_9DIPT